MNMRELQWQLDRLSERNHLLELQVNVRGTVVATPCCGLSLLEGAGTLVPEGKMEEVIEYAKLQGKGYLLATAVPALSATQSAWRERLLSAGFREIQVFLNPNTGNEVHLLGRLVNV